MKKTVEWTEQARNHNVKFQDYMADSIRASERWSQCDDARFSEEEALGEWEGAERKVEESDKECVKPASLPKRMKNQARIWYSACAQDLPGEQ